MINFMKWMGIISLVFLAGCPAPSDSDTDDKTGATSEPGVNLVMSISSTDERNNQIPTNDDAKVDILFLDVARKPLSDKIINISATSGTLSQSSVLTDQEGRGTVTISPPTSLLTGTAPGVFTATPEAVGDEVSDDMSDAEKEALEKVNQPVTLNYEFIATKVAETRDEAATFVSSLQFISTSSNFLSLKGTGGVGYGEISNLIFKVVDNENNPIAGVQVDFTLTTTVGGLALSTESSISNAQGEAFVNVLAGTISTPVRVTASVRKNDDSLLSVQSDLLTVTTGIPDQNSFSLSVNKFAPEGMDYDGEKSEITVRLADRFNNPVPDGTVINFTTEGGRIDGSCETSNSECMVIWTSQNPRSEDGLITILAYAIGHETYYDKNGSGIFDDGDTFEDLGEAFRDDDNSGTFNPHDSILSQDEILIDYDESGDYTVPDGVYNGVPCNHSTDCPVDANNIAGRSNLLVNISSRTELLMASSEPLVRFYELLPGNNSGSCLDSNGKLDTVGVQCQKILADTHLDFLAGADTKDFWVLIENPTALCKTSEFGDRIFVDLDGDGDLEPLTDPEHGDCTYAQRLSAPTGSGISVSSGVGEVTFTPTVVPSQPEALEFSFTVTASNENDKPVTEPLEVIVTVPSSGYQVSKNVTLTDPAN